MVGPGRGRIVAPDRGRSCICRIRSHVPNTLSGGIRSMHVKVEKQACRQAGRQAGRRAGWEQASWRTDGQTDERTNGRVGDYIDCVAGWQRQWHMSPRLLVIADLNMRQRGPCRVVCAAPASYFCLRLHPSLQPLLLLLPHIFFSLPLSWSMYWLSHCRKPDDVTFLITVPMKRHVRNNYELVARSYVVVAWALVTVIITHVPYNIAPNNSFSQSHTTYIVISSNIWHWIMTFQMTLFVKKKKFNFPISYFNKQYIVMSNIGTRKFEDKRMTNRSHFGGSCYNIDCIGKQRYVHNHVAPPCHFVLRVRYIRSKGWGEGRRKKTAMIYYRPQILFLLCARQLRLRSSIFFPFTAHRATFPQLPLSFFLHPLCSAPSLKVTDCLLYYPLVSIFTLLSSVLVSIVPEANSFGHNTSWRTIILKYY